jgi:hypothetical protein
MGFLPPPLEVVNWFHFAKNFPTSCWEVFLSFNNLKYKNMKKLVILIITIISFTSCKTNETKNVPSITFTKYEHTYVVKEIQAFNHPFNSYRTERLDNQTIVTFYLEKGNQISVTAEYSQNSAPEIYQVIPFPKQKPPFNGWILISGIFLTLIIFLLFQIKDFKIHF